MRRCLLHHRCHDLVDAGSNHIGTLSIQTTQVRYLYKSHKHANLSKPHKHAIYINHTSTLIYPNHTNTISIQTTQTRHISRPHRHAIYPIHTLTLYIQITHARYLSKLHKHAIYPNHTRTLSIQAKQARYISKPHKHAIYPSHTSTLSKPTYTIVHRLVYVMLTSTRYSRKGLFVYISELLLINDVQRDQQASLFQIS